MSLNLKDLKIYLPAAGGVAAGNAIVRVMPGVGPAPPSAVATILLLIAAYFAKANPTKPLGQFLISATGAAASVLVDDLIEYFTKQRTGAIGARAIAELPAMAPDSDLDAFLHELSGAADAMDYHGRLLGGVQPEYSMAGSPADDELTGLSWEDPQAVGGEFYQDAEIGGVVYANEAMGSVYANEAIGSYYENDSIGSGEIEAAEIMAGDDGDPWEA
jgi:hypothetical protein